MWTKFRILGAICFSTLLVAGSVSAQEPSSLRQPPAGFTDLHTVPGLLFDIRYHTANNFTGQPLDGYGAPGAWLLSEVANKLTLVQESLKEEGLGLLVYDAYRPRRGTDAMVRWAISTNQEHLLNNGYIARRSGHNHGHTIDLTLVKLTTSTPLDMGTPWDTLTKKSHTTATTGEALKNRLKLKTAMESQGFRYYSKEWWHFRYSIEGSVPRDVPYGIDEANERPSLAPH